MIVKYLHLMTTEDNYICGIAKSNLIFFNVTLLYDLSIKLNYLVVVKKNHCLF